MFRGIEISDEQRRRQANIRAHYGNYIDIITQPGVLIQFQLLLDIACMPENLKLFEERDLNSIRAAVEFYDEAGLIDPQGRMEMVENFKDMLIDILNRYQLFDPHRYRPTLWQRIRAFFEAFGRN